MLNAKNKTALLATTFACGLLSATAASADLGDAINGLSASEQALFDEGKALFEKDFTPNEGLGPLYNETSCVACHGGGGVGGWDPDGTTFNVTHFGIREPGADRFYPAHELGGPVQQKRTIAGHPERPDCNVQADTPPEFLQPFVPGMIISKRFTPGVFGFGLIDAVSDKEILKYVGKKPWKAPGVIGAANYGREMQSVARALTFTLDQGPRTMPVGPSRIGRFGWKSQTATLMQFTQEPFGIELGVTTPFFQRENTPGLDPLPAECAPTQSPDDIDGQQSLRLFYFQALVAPPERGDVGFREVIGEVVFAGIGCTDCHRRKMRTAKKYYAPAPNGDQVRIPALENKVFYPYSDLLIHDMGAENDDRRQMGAASGRFWRTTPLWGIGQKTNFWHDGSITTLEGTIDAHAGEGSWSRDAYNRLPGFLQNWVIRFMESL